MMKMVRGFLGSYTDGFAPSKMPPCGATRTVEVGAAEVVVVVAIVNEVCFANEADGKVAAAKAQTGM
jgi:hypothetical protein